MDPWGKIGYNRLVKFPAKAESASGGHLASSSTKDQRTTRKFNADGSDRMGIRCETRVGLTTGTCDNGNTISGHAFEGLSNGEKIRMARNILISQGKVPNKSNVRRMVRYGKGLNI